MSGSDLVLLAAENLRRRKLRTLLTAAGITIGAAALLLFLALGLGLRRETLRVFQNDYVAGLVFFMRAEEATPSDGPLAMRPYQVGDVLSDDEMAAVARSPGVHHVFPERTIRLVRQIDLPGGEPRRRWFRVIPEEEAAFMGKYLLAGSFWTDPNEPCVVISSHEKEHHEGASPADLVGKTVTVRRSRGEEKSMTLRIAGVADEDRLGFLGMGGGNYWISVPTGRTLYREFEGGLWVYMRTQGDLPAPVMAFARVTDVRRVEEVRNRIRNSGYAAFTASDMAQSVKQLFVFIQAFLAAIGGVALFVALFGITNTMSMAVLERTREIGILKAVGARRSQILRLFLAESAALGVLGGLAGLGLAWGVSRVLNALARGWREGLGPDAELFYIPLWLAALSVAFAAAVSMAAGLLPSVRAARMRPVEALRFE